MAWNIKVNLFGAFYKSVAWFKARVIYVTNNWIYTTNHKRIAVNYFYFVKFSGIVGAVLATIIRLEMAYPGVGILAGDSLQYLSVVTAHAVVMVFFMIMPLLFGAFGNFLLPTQLGVHDVAFPRLNSAAFWFLPAGLIMLCQLVCLDRRYQRINCFNVSEVQTLLRQRYFTNLINVFDHHEFFNRTVLGVRFKGAGFDSITPNNTLNFQYVFLNILQNRQQAHSDFIDSVTLSLDGMSHNNVIRELNYVYGGETLLSWESVSDVVGLRNNYISVSDVLSAVKSLYSTLYVDFTFTTVNGFVTNSTANVNNLLDFNLMAQWLRFGPTYGLTPSYSHEVTSTSSQTFLLNSASLSDKILTSAEELGSNVRHQRSYNPLTRYVFKNGNYLVNTRYKHLYPSGFLTRLGVTRGFRKPVWFFNADFYTDFQYIFNTFQDFYTNSVRVIDVNKLIEEVGCLDNWTAAPINLSGFFNLFRVVPTLEGTAGNVEFMNLRWTTIHVIIQKFSRMYTANNKQQHIYGNWRQLKFTREAWRCRMVASHHQRTLYRRNVRDADYLWVIEKNAKDVLPGWAMVTPFSARTKYTAIGKVDIGLMGVFLVLNSSIVSSANFLVTYRYLSTLNNRKMRDARSFFTEGVMVASWMMIAANPMLVIGILMLLCDRHWQTSFFDYSGGGDTVLFQHMFWFFGHPEVYVIMIPAFGFNNTLLSFYLRKRVSARASLMYSMYTIAFLGFFVWGHHMYMVGLAHTTRMLFSTLTVMISVPAATKLMHWCVTLVNSSFWVELPFLFTLLFIFFFVSGGISGMAVAHTGMDILFHDSFYVVGHFHVMFAGAAMFASFGAFYFYFPAIFGVKFTRLWGYLHIVYFLLGQLMTVIPMIWLGYSGMPRRVLDYPAALGGWHAIVSAGHLLSIAGLMAFFIMIFDSMRQGRAAIRTSFGLSRFNTRFNFYLYEIARIRHVQRRGWYTSRYFRPQAVSMNEFDYVNYEVIEISYFSYALVLDK
jgi:heme/copper-type cytochrome/quinol oxidase subunit 1